MQQKKPTRAQKTVGVKNNRIIFAVLLVTHVRHILQMTFMISILYSPVKAGSLTLYLLCFFTFFLFDLAPLHSIQRSGVRPAPQGAFRLRGKEVVFF